MTQQDILCSGGNVVLPPDLKKEFSDLSKASGMQRRDAIPEANPFRKIGFDGASARLGWVIPPAWQDIERNLNMFLSLRVVRGKSRVIFSGMGGSINATKMLIQILADQDWMKPHTTS